jgi:glycosyltransferase involved in cell wall biosynthesis
MSPTPRVSLIVPAFNEMPHVVRVSLASLRAQTFADFECIVIDESTDEHSARVCRECCDQDSRFIYIRPPTRLGLPGSLNLGVERSRGELIARFDSDDLCSPDRLALQVAFLDAHPDVAVVGGALEVIGETEETLAFRDYPLIHSAIARGIHLTNTIAHPTAMFRRTVFTALGGYNATFRFSEDLDLWLRWLNAGVVFANLPDILVRYRQKHTRRNSKHWRYNLRARVRNFAGTYALLRLTGIVLIALWSAIPAPVQEMAFRAIIFRRQRRNGAA